jgi:hypothetical protein
MKNRILFVVILIVSLLLLTGLTLSNKLQIDEPLELHTIMRLIMMDIHTINEGIYTQNFDLIASGAASINDHPSLSDESRSLVQETLGNRMDHFAGIDQLVHGYADSIKQSAVENDMSGVLDYYQIVQQGCVNCHIAFQEEIREARLSR